MKVSNQWTREQLEAIESRGQNLLVAAAAGAGKTSVLVERIVRLITDPVQPVDVDRLLVVTFTNAAAAEMRERIGRSLREALARQPDSRHLHRQLALLGRAGISTLHSFCLDLLRQHYYRVDLDPSFRVADETETVMLQAEALEELFERRYAREENSVFTALVDSYGGQRDDTVLQELVL
ncbi:MAG TPA: UvrD-helicase domain-containing protein, partial [Bacillota bacterium]|nr:UvrD-helicase domain-containing protein [Bacillota bacterium]